MPPSLNLTVPEPSASRTISPPTSSVKSPPSDIVDPLIVISSTVKVVKVPKLVILVCAAVLSVPTKAVDVILVAPVTTPASTLIVPSKRIAEPAAGSRLIAAPESKVKPPAESISTVPSAVI